MIRVLPPTLFLLAAMTTASLAQEVPVNTLDASGGNLGNSTSQSEPSHASFASTVVVGWNDSSQFAATGIGGLTSLLGFGFSTDGGATFTDGGLLTPATGRINLSDPALAVDAGGNFYYACLSVSSLSTLANSQIAVARSTSLSPVSFGAPALINGVSAGSIQDKEFIAVDTTGGTFDGRVYVAWSEFPSLFGNPSITFARSTSTTPLAFAAPISLSSADTLNQGVMPLVGPDGELYVLWGRFDFGTGNQSMAVVRSNDGGVSFANPDASDPAAQKIFASATSSPGNLSSGGISIRNRGFPYGAVDATPMGSGTRGNLYVSFHADPDGTGPDRADVFFTRSTDGGATWSAPRSITSGPAVTLGRDPTDNDNFQPFLSVSPSTGQITVSFYDRREDTDSTDGDPANTRVRLYRAVSTDGGLSWSNAPMGMTSFVPATGYDPLTNAQYMGDYNYGTAEDGRFLHTFTDCRNLASPPTGSPNPATPTGRSDQDVYFLAEAALSGPDLCITPWGHVTGVGPTWKTPDIFVVDAGGTEVNAVKGELNRLRARVRNVGDADAFGVEVRFRYAPWFAGIGPSALRTLGPVVVDIPAGATLEVPVDWDLSDLSDDHGGLWPDPIDAFTHFCVKVDIQHPDDAHLANNEAQNNFTDVPTTAGASQTRFLIGNPERREVRARLIPRAVPKGYRVRLQRFDGDLGEEFVLKPLEIRSALLELVPPDGMDGRDVPADLVVDVDFEVDGEIVGGISARVAKAGRDGRTRVELARDVRDVLRALLATLEARRIGVSLVDEKKILVNTVSVPARAESLQRLVDLPFRLRGQGGRYLLSFDLRDLGRNRCELVISPLFLVDMPVGSMIGGHPVRSSGALEKELIAEIEERLGL